MPRSVFIVSSISHRHIYSIYLFIHARQINCRDALLYNHRGSTRLKTPIFRNDKVVPPRIATVLLETRPYMSIIGYFSSDYHYIYIVIIIDAQPEPQVGTRRPSTPLWRPPSDWPSALSGQQGFWSLNKVLIILTIINISININIKGFTQNFWLGLVGYYRNANPALDVFISNLSARRTEQLILI